jgi:galactokinase
MNNKVKCFRAPGRVNIIGEHTDYNDGLVLPTNTALYTWLYVEARADRNIRVTAKNFEESNSFSLDDLHKGDDPGWIDYVKGVCAVLQDEGIVLGGANILIDGEIPLGGGLSSSASLELAIAFALLDIAGGELPAPEIAALCQTAERTYAGVNCGIMDQYSIACGQYGKAMMLDCRTLATEFTAIPGELALLVTDSGVKHKLPESGYNSRADECSESARMLAGIDSSIRSLRDASMDLIDSHKETLGDTLYRRSRHIVTEIRRVKETFDALSAGNIEAIGALVSASHASLRDDFEVSCDEVESLVAIADRCDGVYGSRMVGAGFGGCVLSVVEAVKTDAVARNIRESYGAINGSEPWTHVVAPTGPAAEHCE